MNPIRRETIEAALNWMLDQNILVKKSTKDPETFATVRGYLLSEIAREKIGANLVTLFAKATRRRNGKLGKVTLRDAFLTAALGAVLQMSETSISEDEMLRCANIILELLPIRQLEEAGIAYRPLRSLACDASLVGKMRRLCTKPI